MTGSELPATVVIDLPTRLRRGRDIVDVPLPILITIKSGQPVVAQEAFEFALDRARFESFAVLHQMLVTIARLHDNWATSSTPLDNADDADTVIWNYVWNRLYEDQPVSYETVRTEFRYITRFVRFCRQNPRSKSPFGAALAKGSRLFGEEMPIKSTKGFLLHLDSQRRRWLELQDFEPDVPRDLKKVAGPRIISSKQLRKFPTIGQMDDLIDLEKNVVYRAAWCAAAAQGARFSELLQMWRCDVLPGSYGKAYFSPDHPAGEPFLIYAHPSKSVYSGSSYARKGGQERRVVLERYGLVPGKERVRAKEQYGWKSILLFDKRLLSWGYWVVDRYAREFERLLPSIWALHEEARTDGQHPFFWINGSNADHFGKHMRRQVLQRAYAAAAARVGLEPCLDDGGNGHGSRHFCKWYAQERLGLDESEVQLVLRHGSVKSQRSYGRRLSDLHRKLSGRAA
ncbi:hypothetical protein [Agrobacterium tumefaciens]|uniref:hypothetical protein n=1 Tax=Agrobacterium tumefaciens TaxID=358 RepID=UPI002B000C0B|nr:hypothetical protein [Agrobacterium tumefaciens]MEA1842957.1 hypothetical protein [Agrobacterium tumefaciens]